MDEPTAVEMIKTRRRTRKSAFKPTPPMELPFLRTCFFWPLTLKQGGKWQPDNQGPGRGDPYTAFMRRQISKLEKDGQWKRQCDLLNHLPKPDGTATGSAWNANAYAEQIYFHDFIQEALFKNGADDTHPLILMTRGDIKQARITLAAPACNSVFQMDVTRLNLYFFRPGVAILALELSAPNDGKCVQDREGGNHAWRRPFLTEAMVFNDLMRRTHVPYFEAKPGSPAGYTVPKGQVIEGLTWIDKDGTAVAFCVDDDVLKGEGPDTRPLPDRFVENKEARAVAPFKHWLWLINGPAGGDPAMAIANTDDQQPYWRHVSDERLPILSTIELPDAEAYRAITPGDWSRLCFVDSPGSAPWPYASAFLNAEWQNHAYDRYHYAEDDSTIDPVRYLMSGYSMVAVGSGNPKGYNFFGNIIRGHIQRHYFQIMLLAQVDLAVMLSLSSRITGLIKRYETASAARTDAENALAQGMQDAERDFLHYVHRFRFTGVSNQLQPSEMYQKLRNAMKLDTLFEDVKAELETTVNFRQHDAVLHSDLTLLMLDSILTLVSSQKLNGCSNLENA